MSRYIDSDKLKELFPDDGEGSWTYNVTAKSYIDSQPTADVRENVHGEWVGIYEYVKHLEEKYGEKYNISSIYDGSIFCNKCWGMAKARTNFCPNCGCDMRKGETNG